MPYLRNNAARPSHLALARPPISNSAKPEATACHADPPLSPLVSKCPFTWQAAFQLLEERDRLFPASFGSWSAGAGGAGGGDRLEKSGTVGAGAITIAGSGNVAETRLRLQASGSGHRHTIRSGTLRKATARSVGRLETTTWKTKHIELTPGKFAYADTSSVLGKRYDSSISYFMHSGVWGGDEQIKYWVVFLSRKIAE